MHFHMAGDITHDKYSDNLLKNKLNQIKEKIKIKYKLTDNFIYIIIIKETQKKYKIYLCDGYCGYEIAVMDEKKWYFLS
jgi:hypothetical protein